MSDLLKDDKLVNDYKKQGIYPVRKEEAESYALENGVFYFETSSLMGENIKETFDVLIQSYYTTTEYFNDSKTTTENIEEEDSEEILFIPQIKSDFKLPFSHQMDAIKGKNNRRKKSDDMKDEGKSESDAADIRSEKSKDKKNKDKKNKNKVPKISEDEDEEEGDDEAPEGPEKDKKKCVIF
mmetsp:Transcript_1311/g.1172  ORF Transcript_1311/g.1172 Transcript_1311/m.1172 type:complete len:182 (+) Transcript_1311:613-1158(+)